MSTAAKPIVNAADETTLGTYYETNAMSELVNAAKIIQKLGQVPEIRLVQDAIDEPIGVELFVKDVPAMARTLAKSIAQTNRARI